MLIEDYITKNTNIHIKKVFSGKKLLLECKDETQYFCHYCGSFHLRRKDTFTRNIKNISVGSKGTILRIKTHKYCCLDCGHYFNALPQGILKHQQTSEHLKQEVFHKHCQGVSKKDLSRDLTQELMILLNEKMCKYKDCKTRLIPKLLKFIELLKSCGFELFRKLGKTIENWQEEIARMFRFTRSNGITEGFHRKMKLIQRRAYGFRNFENYRLRIRVLCA